jgi:hypothetical protein
MYYVTMFCERAVWLAHGRIEREGPAQGVVEAYEAYLHSRNVRRLSASDIEPESSRTGEAQGKQVGRITSVRPGGDAAPRPLPLATGDELVIDIGLSSTNRDELFHVAVALDTLDGRCVLAASTKRDGSEPLTGAHEYRLRLRVPSLPLAAGSFHVYVFLFDETALFTHDQVVLTEAIHFETTEWTPALVEVEHGWEIV